MIAVKVTFSAFALEDVRGEWVITITVAAAEVVDDRVRSVRSVICLQARLGDIFF